MRERSSLMHEFLKDKEKAKAKVLQKVDNTSIRSLGLVAGSTTSALLMQIPANALDGAGFTVESGVSSWVSIMGTFWTMITGNPLLSTIACGSIVYMAIKMWRAFRH